MQKKVAVEQLRLGMHLKSLCGAWLDHPFWKTEFVLRDPEDLRKLRASGVRECWIDVSKGLDVAVAEAVVAPRRDRVPEAAAVAAGSAPAVPATGGGADRAGPDTTPKSLGEERLQAARLVGQAKEVVSGLFAEARMGKTPDIGGCVELVNEVTSSVWRNPEAMLSLARLKTHDDYTYMHSVAVCALMVALSKQLNLGIEAAREAGLAGLLHDLGKAAMPLEVLLKPGKLTEEEFAVMRGHPEYGHVMLLEKAVEIDSSAGADVAQSVLDVCLHHHERVDGKGYPHGLGGEQISNIAKMSAVCDVYDAITSNRPYKAAWDPSEAIGKMASWRHGHFEEEVFQAFVRSVGIYPTGSLVRMESERLAVVIEQNQHAITKPKVKVFFSAKTRMPIPLEVLDLSDSACTDRLVGRESNKEWKFPHLETLWAGADLLRKMGRG